jgi:hypothetical protein
MFMPFKIISAAGCLDACSQCTALCVRGCSTSLVHYTHLLDVPGVHCLLHTAVKELGASVTEVDAAWHAIELVLKATPELAGSPGDVLQPPAADRHQSITQGSSLVG